MQDFPKFQQAHQEKWIPFGNQCFLTRKASTMNLDLKTELSLNCNSWDLQKC